jgi:hypothetical protein
MVEILRQLNPFTTPMCSGCPAFREALGRTCVLSFIVEPGDTYPTLSLTFRGVEAYKCTYLTSCAIDMIKTAYEKVVRVYDTPWLLDTLSNYEPKRGNHVYKELMHLMIYFDDGPCYEFICTCFDASESTVPTTDSIAR